MKIMPKRHITKPAGGDFKIFKKKSFRLRILIKIMSMDSLSHEEHPHTFLLELWRRISSKKFFWIYRFFLSWNLVVWPYLKVKNIPGKKMKKIIENVKNGKNPKFWRKWQKWECLIKLGKIKAFSPYEKSETIWLIFQWF